MDEFRIAAADEYTHQPDKSPNFNESVYANAFDPAQKFGGWMRLGNRVNEGYAELSVVLYLPDGRVACQFGRPKISANDRFDAGGLRFETREPFKQVTMTYDGEVMLLDDPNQLRSPETMFKSAARVPCAVRFDQTTISPVHGGEPTSPTQQTMYGRDFSLGHFNQHTKVKGSIRVGDREWPLDGNGWRDHSWGPRYWQNIYFYRLFIANFGDDRGLMLLKITSPDGKSRRVGVLMVDGRYEEIVDMDLITDWSEQKDPMRMQIAVSTAKRREIIVADVIVMAPLRNRRRDGNNVIVSRIAEGFTRYAWNGTIGYGMTEYIERIENDHLVGYPL
ncbi:MAG TPA: hypothetical protein VMB26_01830 [Candidatus Binataceae bacterium]|nr:hypothetical protein [Candidatus Binataceae bacterium]